MDSPPRAPAPLHVRRDGDAHRHLGRLRHRADADRHPAGDRHPGDRGRLAVRRPPARRDGAALHRQLRARAHDHGGRDRAHREPVALRRVGHEGVLPPRHEDGDGERAGDRDLADAPEAVSGRGDAAADRQLQRLERPHPPGVDPLRLALRAAALRPHEQLPPDRPRHGSGRADALSVRRQAAPGHDRHRPPAPLRARALAERREQRGPGAEPRPAVGDGEARLAGAPRPAEQQPGRRARHLRAPGKDRERLDAHDRRRRPGPRRLRAADEPRPRERATWRPHDAPEERRRLHSRHRRSDSDDHADAAPDVAARIQDGPLVRPVGLRSRRGRGGRQRGRDRGRPHRADDSPVPRELAEHGHRRRIDPALDPRLTDRPRRASGRRST